MNLSEMVRRLIQKGFAYYDSSFSNPTNAVLNKKSSSVQMNTKANLTKNSKGYSVSEWNTKIQQAYNLSTIRSISLNEAVNIAKTGVVPEWNTNKEAQLKTEYEQKMKEYNEKVNVAKTAWDAYDKAMLNGCTQEQLDLYQSLSTNNKFLIQGLLSGYLTLMKDGKDVSLSSSTNILTKYDKSDDAQAEAEYEAEMKKINRKEKLLDNQMKQLDTEHSAMQQEIQSVQSIIKNHAEKDFSLFA